MLYIPCAEFEFGICYIQLPFEKKMANLISKGGGECPPHPHPNETLTVLDLNVAFICKKALQSGVNAYQSLHIALWKVIICILHVLHLKRVLVSQDTSSVIPPPLPPPNGWNKDMLHVLNSQQTLTYTLISSYVFIFKAIIPLHSLSVPRSIPLLKAHFLWQPYLLCKSMQLAAARQFCLASFPGPHHFRLHEEHRESGIFSHIKGRKAVERT